MRNYKLYAIVGDNGYGMTDNWVEASAFLDDLDNGWPKGFNNEEEAYDYICNQCKLKWSLRKNICSLDMLREKKFIKLDEPDANVNAGSVKPTIISSSKKSLRELLDEDDDVPNVPVTGGRKRSCRQELVNAFVALLNAFEAWIADCIAKSEGKQ
jgi:hypothetical protein